MKTKKIRKFLKELDQYLSEHIIDPCGYDAEKETKEDLVIVVKQLSNENEALLTKLRKLTD